MRAATTRVAADSLRASLLIWYLGRDLKPAAVPTVQPLQAMGVYDAEGLPKSSWSLWKRHKDRPLSTE